MADVKKSWPLSRVTDGAHWDAEDICGRMCIVADAAFLSAGFLPCDASETTTSPGWSLSRRYMLPQLAHREGVDATVLRILRWGRRGGACGGGKIQVDAYVDCNGRQRYAHRERLRLRLAALAPVLSGGMDDAARALTTPDDGASGGAWWLWKLLADQLCRRLFLSICLHGGVAVLPSFDLQVAILCRLRVVEDVARVECASKELRRLVADHDAVLWKAKYEFIGSLNSGRGYFGSEDPAVEPPPFFTDEDMSLMSWKERCAMTTWQTRVMSVWRSRMDDPMPTWMPWVPSALRRRLQTIIDMVRRRCAERNSSPRHHDRPAHQPRTVARTSNDHGWSWRGTTVDDRSSRRTLDTAVLSSKPYRKGNGAGAVHSPSSRHRWSHR